MAQQVDFQRWNRQRGLGIILLTSRNAWRVAKSFWPALLPLWLRGEALPRLGVFAIAGFGVLLFGYTLLEHWRFKFRLRPGALHVKSGVFLRKRTVIPFERIQAVQLSQGALQRLLGLTGLSIDTAGSKGHELEFRALSWADAEALRQAIAPGPRPIAGDSTEEILQLDWRQLARIAMGMNHLRNGLLLLTAPFVLVLQVDGALEWLMDEIPWWMPVMVSLLGLVLWFPALLLAALVGMLASFAVVLMKYYGLTLKAKSRHSFHVQAGLLRRFSFNIERPKIQTATWSNTPLSRLLGFESLLWSQARAGSAEPAREQRLVIPGVEENQRRILDALLFPGWESDAPPVLRPVSALRWVRWAPWCIAAGAWWALVPESFGSGVVVAVLVIWGGYDAHRHLASRKVRLSDSALAAERGWWKRTTTMTQFHQVQRVEVRQAFWHAHRGIAHLILHTAAGSIRLSFLPEREARAFADRMLHAIETSPEPWM
jgi:putative membrane protein